MLSIQIDGMESHMDNLLEEHGEALIYGIVGIVLVLIICFVCENKWKNLTPDYKTDISANSSDFINKNKNGYPVIEADEIIYADYKTKNFNCKDFIKAKDCDGRDITDKVEIYGIINTFKRGVYKIRCVVMAENQLTCTKYINVIVE